MTLEKSISLQATGLESLKRQWKNFNVVIRDLATSSESSNFYSSRIKQGCFKYNFLARCVRALMIDESGKYLMRHFLHNVDVT